MTKLDIENELLRKQVAILENALGFAKAAIMPDGDERSNACSVLIEQNTRWLHEVNAFQKEVNDGLLERLKRQRKELKRLNRQVQHDSARYRLETLRKHNQRMSRAALALYVWYEHNKSNVPEDLVMDVFSLTCIDPEPPTRSEMRWAADRIKERQK